MQNETTILKNEICRWLHGMKWVDRLLRPQRYERYVYPGVFFLDYQDYEFSLLGGCAVTLPILLSLVSPPIGPSRRRVCALLTSVSGGWLRRLAKVNVLSLAAGATALFCYATPGSPLSPSARWEMGARGEKRWKGEGREGRGVCPVLGVGMRRRDGIYERGGRGRDGGFSVGICF